MFRDVESLCIVGIVVSTPVEFTKDGIVSRQPHACQDDRTRFDSDARLLDTLGLDMPTRKIVSEDSEESFLGRGEALCTACQVARVSGKMRAGRMKKDRPEDELWMGHEIGDALEHASGLENEGGKRNALQVHSNPNITNEDEPQSAAQNA